MKRIEKYDKNILYCHVVLIKENKSEKVDIIVKERGHEYFAHDNSDSFEYSLKQAINKISVQIKKIQSKNHNYN